MNPRKIARACLFWVLPVVLAIPCAFVLAALLTELPPELRGEGAQGGYGGAAPEDPTWDGSTRIHDRNGALLREERNERGERATWVKLEDVGDVLPRALLAAEDRRFFDHPGVDPLASVRALWQLVTERRVVSGASTLTQQLARVVTGAPRTARGKVQVTVLALRMEMSLSKDEILEQYLNRVQFGAGTRGVEAAAWLYFGKRASALSLAEAAALASIPRGPAVYDPVTGRERLLRRRDRVLERMEDAGFATTAEVAAAKAEPLVLATRLPGVGAGHFARALMQGAIDPGLPAGAYASIRTTLDRSLQDDVRRFALTHVGSLEEKSVSAASVVVIDNETGDLLAYLGSPDATDARRLGANDGALARRQPGSTLKPFLYELAIERMHMSTATVLPDVDLHFPSATGDYHPTNYDGKLHGPVRMREALGNSFNVPATWTAKALGPSAFVERLRALGFGTVDRSADAYGVGIAVGGVEVRLLDLANAYATLARRGEWRPVRAAIEATSEHGRAVELSRPPARRVLDARASYAITHVLADRNARLASFGGGSVLELPFPVAVKTGTSKGFRDNLTIGYTPRVTVAVWVGNFDGSPMHGVSGVTGAGPLFRDVMIAANELRPAHSDRAAQDDGFPPEPGVSVALVCPLSGKRRTAACDHGVEELFVGEAPGARCDMHVRARVDAEGKLAGAACSRVTGTEERVFEAYPPDLLAWARTAGRPLLPLEESSACPLSEEERARLLGGARGDLSVAFPTDGAIFHIDPGATAPASVELRASAPHGARSLRFEIDGRTMEAPAGRATWALVPGEHDVRVVADGMAPSERVSFVVR